MHKTIHWHGSGEKIITVPRWRARGWGIDVKSKEVTDICGPCWGIEQIQKGKVREKEGEVCLYYLPSGEASVCRKSKSLHVARHGKEVISCDTILRLQVRGDTSFKGVIWLANGQIGLYKVKQVWLLAPYPNLATSLPPYQLYLNNPQISWKNNFLLCNFAYY